MVLFLVALVGLLMIVPFVDQMAYGRVLEAVLLSLVFLSAIPAVGGKRTTLLTGVALLAPALFCVWVGHLTTGVMPEELTQVSAIVFCTFIAAQLGRYIVTAPAVDHGVLCAAAANYLTMGFVWGFAYALVAKLDPHAFAFATGDSQRTLQRFEAVYFSFITLTTVGYGDVLPVSNAARMLAILEAIAGVFYLAILVSRLVSLYSGKPQEQRASSQTES